MILLLLRGNIPAPEILGSMLAYRAVYYFLPLIVAAGLLGLYEIRFRR